MILFSNNNFSFSELKPQARMIRLGGPAPPKVDPDEEKRKANESVVGSVLVFGIIVGLIKASPLILEQFGVSYE